MHPNDWCEAHKSLRIDCAQQRRDCRSKTKGAWISVKERLPETSHNVLVYNDYGNTYVNWYNVIEQHWNVHYDSAVSTITHWQPLPEPPEAE